MKAKSIYMLNQVKDFIRQPYAWPGGYPMFMIMSDGGSLCHKCAKANFKEIVRATISGDPSEWCACFSDINWEEKELYCDNCHEKIEPAYSED